MYTANTMASAIEALGMALPYSSSIPATIQARWTSACEPALRFGYCLEKDIKPRDIMTREAFENAMVVVMALGGSTNAVLHLIAMARAVDVPLTIDDFQKTSDRVPYIADLKPSGKYRAGRFARRRRHARRDEVSAREGLLDGDCLTVTGKTIAENLAALPGLKAGQDVVHPIAKPDQNDRPHSHHARQLLPGRRGGEDHRQGRPAVHRPANCFDSEEDMLARDAAAKESTRATWSSFATKARKAAPACRRCLRPPPRSWAPASAKDVALITDGRFSGGSHGFIVGHVTPEAQIGGPIALVKNGDQITIDAEANTDHARTLRRRTSQPPKRVEGPAVQSHPRHAVQVHQEREERERRLRDGRVTKCRRVAFARLARVTG